MSGTEKIPASYRTWRFFH